MRILVVAGSQAAAVSDVIDHSSPNVEINPRQMLVRKGDTEIHYVVVKGERDTDRLRGLRFDHIVEHSSFNPYRSWDKGLMLTAIRAIVLR